MAEWISCPSCQLRHSVRPGRLCPRCRTSVDGALGNSAASEPETPVGSPFSAAPLPDVPEYTREPRSGALVSDRARCRNHPEVEDGLVRCARCGETFCGDCVVALRGTHYCAGCKSEQVRDLQSGAAGHKLGVVEALGLAWQRVMRDLWPLWLVGLVYMIVQQAVGVPGYIPYVGVLWSIVNAIFIQPPLQVGFVYALRRTIDGGSPNVADLFEGYRQRYFASIVVMLPMYGAILLMGGVLVGGVVLFAVLSESAKRSGAASEGATILGVTLLMLGALVFAAVVVLLSSAIWFACVALWDTQDSGWQAFGAAARVVWANAGATALLALLMGLIFMAAALLGILTLCVGLLFTVPLAWIWIGVTFVYLYRSWSEAEARV